MSSSPVISENNPKNREVFAETGGLYGPWPSPEKHNIFCIKYDQKKIIYNDTSEQWEFYDLKNDPDEISNIYDTIDSNTKSQYKKRLIFYLEKNNIDTKIS